MDDRQDKKFEERIDFLAKHYCEGRLNSNRAWNEFSQKRGTGRVLPLRRYLSIAASVAVLLAAAGSFFLIRKNTPDWIVVSAMAGEVKDLWLPDSSYVSLAGLSTLRYDRKSYNRDARRVQLAGKGYFEVRPDREKQFAVTSELAVVTVLGTTFQINDYSDSLQVDVFTGKVSMAVHSEESPLILTAGMSARYKSGETEPQLIPDDSLNKLSWKTGILKFRNVPIPEVIKDLEKYYGVTIVNNAEDQTLALNATFEHLPLGEVLLIINQTLDTQLIAK